MGSVCESGWTGDRCTFPLRHSRDHSNDLPKEFRRSDDEARCRTAWLNLNDEFTDMGGQRVPPVPEDFDALHVSDADTYAAIHLLPRFDDLADVDAAVQLLRRRHLDGPLTLSNGTRDWARPIDMTVHTVRGREIGPEGSPYGVTHDMDCPGCRDTPFTASPRSETYWSS